MSTSGLMNVTQFAFSYMEFSNSDLLNLYRFATQVSLLNTLLPSCSSLAYNVFKAVVIG